jgi:hypothetical protein
MCCSILELHSEGPRTGSESNPLVTSPRSDMKIPNTNQINDTQTTWGFTIARFGPAKPLDVNFPRKIPSEKDGQKKKKK